jgi:hypothetical protein
VAHTICELQEWRRPNGKLKSAECVERFPERNTVPGPVFPAIISIATFKAAGPALRPESREAEHRG